VVDDGGDPPCWADRVCEACGRLVESDAHVCSAIPRAVTRQIVAFHQDDAGEWVAELSCLHNQHVRHRPPFQLRPWVLDDKGRTGRIGSPIDCPLCARAELPEGLHVVRTAGPFDADTVPPGVLGSHIVADRTWACVHVRDGSVLFTLETEPPLAVRLHAGDRQAIPPGLIHMLSLEGPVRLTVDVLTRVGSSGSPGDGEC